MARVTGGRADGMHATYGGVPAEPRNAERLRHRLGDRGAARSTAALRTSVELRLEVQGVHTTSRHLPAMQTLDSSMNLINRLDTRQRDYKQLTHSSRAVGLALVLPHTTFHPHPHPSF